MARLTIGWRLTLWYGAFLLVALAGFGVVVYTTFARNLLSEVDRALDEELVELALAVGNARNQPELLAVLERDFGGHAFYEIQVTTRTGQAVFTTPGLDGRPLVLPAPSVPPVRDGICVTVSAAANRYRVRAREVTGPDGPLVVAAAD
jgi:hypothetical protein